MLNFSSTLHVPNLLCNLFSVSKFLKDNNCFAKFFQLIMNFKIWVWEQVLVVNKVPFVLDEIKLWH